MINIMMLLSWNHFLCNAKKGIVSFRDYRGQSLIIPKGNPDKAHYYYLPSEHWVYNFVSLFIINSLRTRNSWHDHLFYFFLNKFSYTEAMLLYGIILIKLAKYLIIMNLIIIKKSEHVNISSTGPWRNEIRITKNTIWFTRFITLISPFRSH